MRSAFFSVPSAVIVFASVLFGSNPLPFVSQPLIPASTAPGGAAFTLTVTGSQFVSGATVLWNGRSRPTTFDGAAKLQAQIPAADIASPGTATITVVNPAPGGGSSNVVYFPVSMPRTTVAFNGQTEYAQSAFSLGAIGDVNGDGKPDAIGGQVMNNVPSVLTFLGNGDGTFLSAIANPSTCRFDQGYQSVVSVGDFNNDARLDILATDSSNLCVMLGNGDGTFQPGSTIRFEDFDEEFAVLGDFDGDGKLDVAISGGGGNVNIYILLGNGDGTLQPPVAYPSGFCCGGTYSIAIGDFNHDGKLDLLVDGDGVAVLFGNGDGTFQAGVQIPINFIGYSNLLVADFNGDGNLDIVSSAGIYPYLAIWLGNGDGTFQPEVDYSMPAYSNCSAVADFNSDGKLDIGCSGPVQFGGPYAPITGGTIYLGNGDGSFTSKPSFTGPPGTNPGLGTGQFNVVGTADFNNDGEVDLMSSPGVGLSSFLQTSFSALPQTLVFPLQPVGTKSVKQDAIVTNVGTFTINISSINLVGANASEFTETNNCGATLSPGNSCTFTAQFAPSQSPPVSESAQIAIEDNAVSSPQYIDLFGSNTGELLTPHIVKFGAVPVGQNKNATVTLTNNSGSELAVGRQFNIYGSDPQDFSQTNNCPAVLGAHKSCTIDVTFSPKKIGTRRASLSAHYLPYKTYMVGTGQ